MQLFQVTQGHPTVKSADKMVHDDELVAILKQCYDQIAAEEAKKQQSVHRVRTDMSAFLLHFEMNSFEFSNTIFKITN